MVTITTLKMSKSTKNKPLGPNLQGIKDPKGFLLKRWFTLSEAAIYTGYDKATLRQAVYDGQFGYSQKGPRGKWILDVYELDKFILSNFRMHDGPATEQARDSKGRFSF